MKKILIVFCVIVFTSCMGVETPVFTDNVSNLRPFVVNNIRAIDEKNCVYITNKWNFAFDEVFSTKASFVAKKGLFQIGDTVTVCKFTKVK